MENFTELYYQRPYIQTFEAEVIACEKDEKGWQIELSQTAFYPEGGGQPADIGSLLTVASEEDPLKTEIRDEAEKAVVHADSTDRVRITDVQKKQDRILHRADRPLETGTKVRGVIDWERRMDHTQGHTGEHILSGIIHRRFGYENVGFHMNENLITIDISGPLTWEELMICEREANQVVQSNLPVRELFPQGKELEELDYRSKKELEGIVRIIDIPGADTCACCGTHLMYTGEVGMIKALSLMNYKKGVRIEMVCGRLALQDYERKVEQNTEISRLLSAKPMETAAAVARLKEEQSALNYRITEMADKYLALRLEMIRRELTSGSGDADNSSQICMVFESGIDNNSARRFCNEVLKEKLAPTAAVLIKKDNGNEPEYSYIIGTTEGNLREKAKSLNSALNGRGGGSPEMIQGSFKSSEEKIREVLLHSF
ncbi:MAG: alanyl-tRNA editing protein [Eubacteriales bacterium]|nr:alanyl-tRNA editing protein [Eubacteriales bacterium]